MEGQDIRGLEEDGDHCYRTFSWNLWESLRVQRKRKGLLRLILGYVIAGDPSLDSWIRV